MNMSLLTGPSFQDSLEFSYLFFSHLNTISHLQTALSNFAYRSFSFVVCHMWSLSQCDKALSATTTTTAKVLSWLVFSLFF